MNNKIQRSLIYSQAYLKWGREAVLSKAIEECGELISALSKYGVCEHIHGSDTDAIVGELADVIIMCEQLGAIYSGYGLDERIEFKLRRLQSLLDPDAEQVV